jgi:type I restriction enzyme S subunit
MRKLKYVAEVRLSSVDKKREEGEPDVRLCNYTDVYNNATIDNSIGFMPATASPEEIRRFALRQGDVIVTKDSEAWDDIAVPAYVAEDLDHVLCGYHLALVRPDPKHLEGRFLRYAFSAQGIVERFHVEALGVTRFALGYDALASVAFPVPTLEEQRTIAAFLDRETAKIDALIAKRERLLELLEEKRTALITRAVTKGSISGADERLGSGMVGEGAGALGRGPTLLTILCFSRKDAR